MARWHAPYAWVGGPELASDVRLTAADGVISDVSFGPPEVGDHLLRGIAIPGFVTAHSHAFHRALRGRTHHGTGDFWTWRDHMYALANRLEPASYRALAAEVFAEMLRAGYTTVGEFHYVHHRPDGTPYPTPHAMELAVVDAAAEAGIRLTLLDTCYLHGGIDRPLETGQARFSDGSIEAWADRVRDLAALLAGRPTVRFGLAAHSIRAVAPPELVTVAEVAAGFDAVVHAHVSEQRAENEAAVARYGRTPIRLLADAGLLGPRFVAVHATHVDTEDREVLAASGAGVCFCPTTEADLGDGIGPAAELRRAGVSISLGSDSNAVVDPWAEAAALERHDRLRLERRGLHSPEALLTSATAGGLAALGWGRHGPLAVGTPADIVVLDPGHASLAGWEPTGGVGGLVFGATAGAVTDVFVAGRQVVHDGHSAAGHSPAGLSRIIQEVTS